MEHAKILMESLHVFAEIYGLAIIAKYVVSLVPSAKWIKLNVTLTTAVVTETVLGHTPHLLATVMFSIKEFRVINVMVIRLMWQISVCQVLNVVNCYAIMQELALVFLVPLFVNAIRISYHQIIAVSVLMDFLVLNVRLVKLTAMLLAALDSSVREEK